MFLPPSTIGLLLHRLDLLCFASLFYVLLRPVSNHFALLCFASPRVALLSCSLCQFGRIHSYLLASLHPAPLYFASLRLALLFFFDEVRAASLQLAPLRLASLSYVCFASPRSTLLRQTSLRSVRLHFCLFALLLAPSSSLPPRPSTTCELASLSKCYSMQIYIYVHMKIHADMYRYASMIHIHSYRHTCLYILVFTYICRPPSAVCPPSVGPPDRPDDVYIYMYTYIHIDIHM